MADTPISTTSESTSGGLPGLLTRHRQPVAYALFALAVAFAAVGVWLFFLAGDEGRRWASIWTGCWLMFLSALATGTGLFHLLYEPSADGSQRPTWATRIMVLVAGGLAGLATVCLAALLVYVWWSSIAGGLKVWRHEWVRLGSCGLALFGGLGLMFASLQLARAGERTTPWMRRLLYGYNTALTGLLLITILGVFNVLTYVPLQPFKVFNTITDWTSANLYSLSDASKNLLASLDKPVKIYALVLASDEIANPEMHALLDNCRAASDKVEVEYISPDLNPARLNELVKKYSITEPTGLLVVYGTAPKEEHEFIKLADLFPTGGGRDNVKFAGESLLMSKLSLLSQHHAKTIVYFTQGNGEPDLNDTNENAVDEGLGVLKKRLEQRNYEVRPLHLDATTKVPADAALVVVARPTNPGLSVKMLDEYMNPKVKSKKPGKLVVLEDVTPDQKIVHTDVDDLLGRFGVEVKADRLLDVNALPRGYNPRFVRVVANRAARTTQPIVQAFQGMNSAWRDVRTVQAKPPAAGASPYQTVTLFEAARPTFSQTNLNQDPVELMTRLLQQDDLKELRARANVQNVPVALAVTAPRGPAGDPHTRMGPQDPRLVVFGDTTWITNRFMREASGEPSYDLFASTLAWLQGHADVGTSAESKERKVYAPQISPSTETYLEWVPLTLMLIGVVGLGSGIWAVRRR